VAPTDAQLDYIRNLCEERGYPMPAVHSKQEASLLIGELLRREYRPEWDYHDETDADRETEALARANDAGDTFDDCPF
jgi:hypothetical protein